LALQRDLHIEAISPDDTGIGGGLTDLLQNKNFTVYPFISAGSSTDDHYANKRAEGYFRLQKILEQGWLKIINDPKLIEQLLAIRYKYKTNGQKLIVGKDDIEDRQKGIKSPDRADALMMAVYYADTLMAETPRVQGYSINDDTGFDVRDLQEQVIDN
jgi:hypothetical protein